MNINIVHISDIHTRSGWHEEQGVVFKEFLLDLRKQIKDISDPYFIFTGDILQAGGSASMYDYFIKKLIDPLLDIGANKNRMIFIPGNHDVDREEIKRNLITLKSLQEKNLNETQFNNAIHGELHGIIYPKFQSYIDWQKDISIFSLKEDNFYGKGFMLGDDFGIYILNTALYSFGGINDENGSVIDDNGNLPVETRELHQWLQDSNCHFRILAMHHPASTLADWAKKEITEVANKSFNLVLCGHSHENQILHKDNGRSKVIECVAPPLFTKKSETLGYSIISADSRTHAVNIRYRQWVSDCFVTGTALSKTDDGTVKFNNGTDIVDSTKSNGLVASFQAIGLTLKNSFEDSLKCYASLPALWTPPIIASAPEHSQSTNGITLETADKLVDSIRNCVIKAPPQFGLTSLGRYLAYSTWNKQPGRFICFLDAMTSQNHETAIKKNIENILEEKGLNESNLHGIVLDNADQSHDRLINNINKVFPNIPIIILFTIPNFQNIQQRLNDLVKFEFDTLYLWSLNRDQIRSIVKDFVVINPNLEEDSLVTHLTNDIENLNLHRSPINCITLLTVYEKQIDYSPSNRTEMLERFLFLIFSAYKKTPNYSNFPDMKDSLYVLGYFCEKIIRSENGDFKKSDFLSHALAYCKEKLIDVDIAQLFDVLEKENIIVLRGSTYCFRYIHWIYFFSAHRMYHDIDFRDHVLSEMRYTKFPEIIEFYSGIDRRRGELLDILTADLKTLNASFEERTKIRHDFDPYEEAKWSPSEQQIDELKARVAEEVNATTLPNKVKDQIVDTNYDRGKPYVQEITTFVNDSSLYQCSRIMAASARALRNSDYVDSGKKKEILDEIIRSWSKILQMLVIVSPALADHRYVAFENLTYTLSRSFDSLSGKQLWLAILSAVPGNVVGYYERDISSARLVPLMADFLNSSGNEAGRYIVAATLLRQKSRGWKDVVKKYMLGLEKNSFYLRKIFLDARYQYKYGFSSSAQKIELEELLGLAIAKHELGASNPSKTLIKETAKLVVSRIKTE